MSSILQSLDNQPGFLKAGLLGFAGSGKTMTATLIAIGTREFFKLDGPIAMFDTEGGSAYLRDMVRERTGKPLLGVRSRSIDDLLNVGHESVKTGVSVLIVDSMTHIWRDVVDSYKREVNSQRAAKGWEPRTDLQFQDWGPIKAKFAEWTDFFLNAPLHIVICGRAGLEYADEVNERGKKEKVVTGTKMQTEKEFGFEPSLLVEMEIISERVAGKRKSGGAVHRRATVIKDRFDVIDGKQFQNPTFNDFLPHIKRLAPADHAPIDMSPKTKLDVNETGDTQWVREKRNREKLCEEIAGVLTSAWPGQSAEDKKWKADILWEVFGTRSWTAVEGMDAQTLRGCLEALREHEEVRKRTPEGRLGNGGGA